MSFLMDEVRATFQWKSRPFLRLRMSKSLVLIGSISQIGLKGFTLGFKVKILKFILMLKREDLTRLQFQNLSPIQNRKTILGLGVVSKFHQIFFADQQFRMGLKCKLWHYLVTQKN